MTTKTVFKKIVVGSDHGAFDMKANILEYLKNYSKSITVEDIGIKELKPCDYPDIASEACKKIQNGEFDAGILICGSGIGISIAANKYNGIRAALCHDNYSSKMCRKHNNANVLCFGGRNTGIDVAKEMIDNFLTVEFEGLVNDRHKKRVDLITEIEKNQK
eukprot:gene3810-6971_t